MTKLHQCLSTFALIGCGASLAGAAAVITTPTDRIFQVSNTVAGMTPDGAAGNPQPGETVDHVIDGVGQKYLNLNNGGINSGFVVLPDSSNANALGTNVTGFNIYTANDSENRDPASYTLEGTNDSSPGTTSNWTLISSGALALPAARQTGGGAALDPAAEEVVSFTNPSTYLYYRVLFPTRKGDDCCVQLGELDLTGTVVAPEPASLAILGLSTAGLLARRRRRA